jgi:hypothetical protein
LIPAVTPLVGIVVKLRGDLLQVVMTQERHQFRIRKEWYVFRIVNGIKIRNQRDGDPVPASDTVVTAEDHARFPGTTAA